MFKFPKVKVYTVESFSNGIAETVKVTVYNNRSGVVTDVQPRIGHMFDRLVGRQHFSVESGWNPIVNIIITDELNK